jgi:hypothetical protein
MTATNRLLPAGAVILLAIALFGLWLIVSPFLIGSQPAGALWLPSTLNAVIVGAILVLASLLGVLLAVALDLRDAARAPHPHVAAPRAGRAPNVPSAPYGPPATRAPLPEPPRGFAPPGQAVPGSPYVYGPRPSSPPPPDNQGQPGAYPPIYDPVYNPSAHDPYAGHEAGGAPPAMPAREPRPSYPAPTGQIPDSWSESWPAAWEDDGHTPSSAQRPNPPRAGAAPDFHN